MNLPTHTHYQIPPRGFDSGARVERRWQAARDRLPFFREWRLIGDLYRAAGLPAPSLYLIPIGILIGLVFGAIGATWAVML